MIKCNERKFLAVKVDFGGRMGTKLLRTSGRGHTNPELRDQKKFRVPVPRILEFQATCQKNMRYNSDKNTLYYRAANLRDPGSAGPGPLTKLPHRTTLHPDHFSIYCRESGSSCTALWLFSVPNRRFRDPGINERIRTGKRSGQSQNGYEPIVQEPFPLYPDPVYFPAHNSGREVHQ